MKYPGSVPNTMVSTLDRNGCNEHFVTVLAGCREEPDKMFQRLGQELQTIGGTIAKMHSIGLFTPSGAAKLEQRYCVDCPSCQLKSGSVYDSRQCPVNALFVHTVSGTSVSPVWLGGQIVGTTYEDEHARYCQLNDVLPESHLSRDKQVRQVLERSEMALKSAGMSFSDVVRTWFHLDHIFDWYDLFNQSRDQFFKERSLYERLVPASTGVGGANQANTDIVCNLLAVQSKDGAVSIRTVPSPLQCPAIEYGSSFSRAVEIETPDHKRLFISGTASIAPAGETLFNGDVDQQIEQTMKVVMAILDSRGLKWTDVTRAIGYVKERKDLVAFERYCARHEISSRPVVVVVNDVCREDLLFELELDAVQLRLSR